MIRILVLISLFLFSMTVWADEKDCSTVRLDQGSGSMANVEPTDQKLNNICYAVAAEEVFDAYRKKINAGANLSSVRHAAITNSINRVLSGDAKSIGDFGGYTGAVLETLIKKGGCDRVTFDQEHELTDLESRLDGLKKLKEGYESKKIFSGMVFEEKPYHGLEWQAAHYREMNQVVKFQISSAKADHTDYPVCFRDAAKAVMPEVPTVSEMYRAFQNSNREDFLRTLNENVCPEKARTFANPSPVLVQDYVETPEMEKLHQEWDSRWERATTHFEKDEIESELHKLFQKLRRLPANQAFALERTHRFVDTALVKSGMPVVISFCVNEIMSGVRPLFSHERCISHVGVVIGRKWDSSRKQCRVLVRNSWGNISSDEFRRGVDAEGPNFWVDESRLYTTEQVGARTLRAP
jgi:hypothetical protein